MKCYIFFSIIIMSMCAGSLFVQVDAAVISLDFSTENNWMQEDTAGTAFENGVFRLNGSTSAGGYVFSQDPSPVFFASTNTGASFQDSGSYSLSGQKTAFMSRWGSRGGYYSGINCGAIVDPVTANEVSLRVYGGTAYTLYYSMDGSAWNVATSGKTPNVGSNSNFYSTTPTTTKTFTPVTGAYWKLAITSGGGDFKMKWILKSSETTSYVTDKSYYIYSTGSQVNTKLWDSIDSVTTSETTSTNTSLKYLVSFDGKKTWKYWNGSAWESSSLDDLQTKGMDKTALESITRDQWLAAGGFEEGTLDFAIDARSLDLSSTPELDAITINYKTDTYDRISNGLDSFNGLNYSEGEKEQLYWLYKNGKAGLNPENIIIDNVEWQYYGDEFLPGEDPDNPFEIGYTYEYNGMRFVKLGSGIGELIIPEPSSLALIAFGILGLISISKKF